MTIDIDQLTEGELRVLHRRITDRIRMLSDLRQRHQMIAFHVGEKVMFATQDHEMIFGVILKMNQKTVSVLSEDGTRWKVSPGLLKKMPAKDITPEQILLA